MVLLAEPKGLPPLEPTPVAPVAVVAPTLVAAPRPLLRLPKPVRAEAGRVVHVAVKAVT